MNTADDTHESRRCPGCQAVLPLSDWPGASSGYNASPECAEVAGQLLGFEVDHQAALGHLHQLRIDAYGAQHVGPQTRPITTIFALNGLYMYFERGSGNLDVRTAHGIMANSYSEWPVLTPPTRVGTLTAHAVLQAAPDGVRAVEQRLIEWARQVWEAWPGQDQQLVRDLTIQLVPARYFHR
ncbi:DUF5946 family protein [Kribbella monticola]|uniref:DUF5946 family protein n=1 Tax=Kribbella monticola TaxID=2185285 RepID=UPI000DD3F064|nr:DUF5946 family protein [Kribbella monticola]